MRRVLVIISMVMLLTLEGCGVAPSDTSLSAQPTPTPVPTLWTQSMVTSDIQGFKYSVRESTVSLTPTPPSDSGINISAPPADDWLDMHIQVTNLVTDRPAVFQYDMIEIFGQCDSYGDGEIAPNGQCLEGNGTLFSNGVDFSIGLSAGGTGDIYLYEEWPKNLDPTQQTIWLLDELNLNLVGGAHLTPLPINP